MPNDTQAEPRPDPFGFDPAHIVEMRVEHASEWEDLPGDWPCEIVGRAAKLMQKRAQNATVSASGRWIIRGDGNSYPQSIADSASAILVADAFEAPGVNRIAAHVTMLDPVPALLIADAWLHQADDMADHLAHLHACAAEPGYVVHDERESARYDWTATLRAAVAYLREDAPKTVA